MLQQQLAYFQQQPLLKVVQERETIEESNHLTLALSDLGPLGSLH